mmetsp:Transcript_25673/g.65287  ORF Transcript_25673/g.65287 Transcript_25673/m.65287 type:complete len:508 (-) Transcript_25673:1123-2646(-)
MNFKITESHFYKQLNNLAKKKFLNQMGFLMNKLIRDTKYFLDYDQYKDENDTFFILKEGVECPSPNPLERERFECIDISKSSVGFRKFIRNSLVYARPQIEKLNSTIGPEINFIIHIGKPWYIRQWIQKFINVTLPETLHTFGQDGKLLLASEIPADILLNDEPVLQRKVLTQHLTFLCDQDSFLFGQQLKFAYGLSGHFFFHCSLDEIDSFKLSNFHTIQSLFITSIYRNCQIKNSLEHLKKIIIYTDIYHQRKMNFNQKVKNDCLTLLEKRFDEAWNNALEYLSITEESLPFSRDEIFTIKYRKYQYHVPSVHNHNIDDDEEMDKALTKVFLDNLYLPDKSSESKETLKFFPSLNLENYQEFIMDSWIKSQTADYIPIGKKEIPVNYWTKKLCSRYLIENFFDKIVFNSMVNLLKKWYSMTEKGIYIKNINQNLMYLIKNIQTQVLDLGKKLKNLDYKKQYDVSIGHYFSKKEIILINHYSKKAWSFFERHLKKIWFFSNKNAPI